MVFVFTVTFRVKRGYKPVELHYTGKEVVHILIDAIPSFAVPVLVLGSIYSGICTPTEAAAIGCLLGVIISVFIYKEVSIGEVPYLLFRSVALGAPVLLIIGISTAFGRILAITQAPVIISSMILGSQQTKLYFCY